MRGSRLLLEGVGGGRATCRGFSNREGSIDFDERANFPEPRVAYASHDQKVLGASERPVTFASLDYPLREGRPDARQTLQFSF